MRRILSAVILAALIANAHADEKLTGIKQISLLMGGLDDDEAKKCGLTEALLKQSMMYPLSSSRITITPLTREVVSARLNLNATSMTLINNSCVTSLRMELYALQFVHLNSSGREVFVKIDLWNAGSLHTGAIQNHSRQIEIAVEGHTKRFITEWNLANKER